jgi:hypothetical protein
MMKKYSDKEIKSKCQAIWDAQHEKYYCMSWGSDGKIEVETNTENEVCITVSCMYEAPPLNLEVLTELSEFFGTKNINDDDRFNWSGCETCDYGSSYGYTLTIRPE